MSHQRGDKDRVLNRVVSTLALTYDPAKDSQVTTQIISTLTVHKGYICKL